MEDSLSIIHLDDHTLFHKGLRTCMSKLRQTILLEHYQYSHHALDAVKERINTKEKLDLIITDLAHMGENGYQFATAVREHESNYFLRIPILLLTMQSPKTSPIIQQGLDERKFDVYLSKGSTCEQIYEAISTLTGMRLTLLSTV